jgi:hypothetical protein
MNSAVDMLTGSWSSGQSISTGAHNGTGFNTRNGSPLRGLRAVVHLDSFVVATTNSLSSIVQTVIQVSADNTNWRTIATGKAHTATSTSRPINEDIGPFTVPVDEPYVRAVTTPTANGGTGLGMLARIFLTDGRRTPSL